MTKDFRKYLILTVILEIMCAALIGGMIFFAWIHQAEGIAMCSALFSIAYIAYSISGKFLEGAFHRGMKAEIIDFDDLLENIPLKVIKKIGENQYEVLKTSAHPYFYPDLKRIVKNIHNEAAKVGCEFSRIGSGIFFKKVDESLPEPRT